MKPIALIENIDTKTMAVNKITADSMRFSNGY